MENLYCSHKSGQPVLNRVDPMKRETNGFKAGRVANLVVTNIPHTTMYQVPVQLSSVGSFHSPKKLNTPIVVVDYIFGNH